MDIAPTTAARERAEARSEAGLWWILLITGSLWLVFALIVFQFDARSVNAIALLVGLVCLGAAVAELPAAMQAHGGRRFAILLLAAAFAVIGVIALVHPQDSFSTLATIFAFYLLLRGIFDVVGAFLARGLELWWVGLISGTVQILLAFWAAGNFGHKSTLLIVWVGATALMQGVIQIVRAFELRSVASGWRSALHGRRRGRRPCGKRAAPEPVADETDGQRQPVGNEPERAGDQQDPPEPGFRACFCALARRRGRCDVHGALLLSVALESLRPGPDALLSHRG